MSPLELELAEHTAQGEGRVRYRVLGSLCVLALVAYLHRVGFATAAPELKRLVGLSDLQVGYLMSAFMLSYGLVEVPFGVLGDRMGARHLLTMLVVGWSVFTGLIACVLWLPAGTVLPLAALLAIRIVFGVFQGGMFPAVSRILTDWMPVEERGLSQGCIWTASRLGGALAPLVVVQLFAAMGIGSLSFWTLAAVGFVWCLWFWPWFRDTPETMPGVSQKELLRITAGRPKRAHSGHVAIPWSILARSRSVWCLCLMYGGLGLSGNFFITMLPTYLRAERGFDARTAGWISSVPLACGVVGCLFGGYLSDRIIRASGHRRWGRRAVGGFGLGLAACGLLSTTLVSDPIALAALLGLAFFGNDMAMGPAWAACADIGEQYAGTLGGTMNMFGSFTGALGAVIAGKFLTDTPTLFTILASSYALGAVLWMGVDVSRTLAAQMHGDQAA